MNDIRVLCPGLVAHAPAKVAWRAEPKLRAMTKTNSVFPISAPAPEEEIIFSLRDGYVLGSWPGTNASVRLGRHEVVAAMMGDFLAQDALGRRLARSQSIAVRGNRRAP